MSYISALQTRCHVIQWSGSDGPLELSDAAALLCRYRLIGVKRSGTDGIDRFQDLSQMRKIAERRYNKQWCRSAPIGGSEAEPCVIIAWLWRRSALHRAGPQATSMLVVTD